MFDDHMRTVHYYAELQISARNNAQKRELHIVFPFIICVGNTKSETRNITSKLLKNVRAGSSSHPRQ